MKKLILFLLLGSVFSQAALAQSIGGAILKRGGKMLRPLSNEAIQSLVRRGHGGLVLRRALGVNVQHNYPAAAILKDGELNRVLLRQAWRQSAVTKYRWEERNILGLNTWLMVLSHRIREKIKVNPAVLNVLEQELLLAQRDAEQEFIKRFKYSHFAPDFQQNPAFLDLLGESVAQRLETHVLPLFSSLDRVRFLQVLMRGVFAGPVDWQEVHISFLNREIRETLNQCAPQMTQVQWYGKMKNTMRECARQTAHEAAKFNITSVVKLREMFIEDLQEISSRFDFDENVAREWQMLISYLKEKQRTRTGIS